MTAETDFSDPALASALEHFNAGQLAEARQVLEALLARAPNHPDALRLLGAALIDLGEPHRAVPALEGAIRAEPNRDSTHFELGRAHLALGRQSEALAAFRQALLLAPGDARYHYALGSMLARTGSANAPLAITSLRTATQIAPQFVPAYRLLARTLMGQGKVDEAVAQLELGLRAVPGNIDLLTDLAMLLHERGHLDKAINAYGILIGLKPDDRQTYINLSDALHRANRHDEADDVMLAALERWPRDPSFMSTTVHGCFRRETAEAGYIGLQRALKGNMSLMDDACYILWRHGHRQWAEEMFQLHLKIIDATQSDKPEGLYSFKQTFYPRHIGELALASDVFFKMRQLGWLPQIQRIGMVAKAGGIANRYLLDLLAANFPEMDILPDDEAGLRLRLYDGNVIALPDGRILRREDAMSVVQSVWENENRAPLLNIPAADREAGEKLLRQLGIGEKDWFVCLHVRDSSYNAALGMTDEANLFRNSSLIAHKPAIDLIRAAGGLVVRMGREGAPLPREDGIIDYPHSGMVQDLLDIYLVARCRFFIGNASGITGVANLFGRPVAMTNALPYAAGPFSRHDLVIHKFLQDMETGRQLTIAEIGQRQLVNYYFQHEYDEARTITIENSEEDILGLARDMLAQVELLERGANLPAPDDAQMRWRRALGADVILPECRVAPSFLARHPGLLDGT